MKEEMTSTQIIEDKESMRRNYTLEFAEAAAKRTFPEDTRGQELVRKKLTKGLLTEEEEELASMREGHERGNIEIVPIYTGTTLEVLPDDRKGKVLMTTQLNGCVATVVVCQSPEGKRIAQLTHFPDFATEKQGQKIDELTTDEMRTAVEKKVVLFFQKKNEREEVERLNGILKNNSEKIQK